MARKAKVVKQEKVRQENIKKEVEEPKEEAVKLGEDSENLFGEDESGEEEY